MNEILDIDTVDLPPEAIDLIAERIEERRAIEQQPAGFISCAVVQLMRSAELRAQLGEATFEHILGEFRQRLVEFCRSQKNLIQLPGEKFCIVLADLTSLDHLDLATAKLKRVLAQPIAVANLSVRVQTNAGFQSPGSPLQNLAFCFTPPKAR